MFDWVGQRPAMVSHEGIKIIVIWAAPLTAMIEVQTGSYLSEDDIVRIEDLYNRV